MKPAERNNRGFYLQGLGLVVTFVICLAVWLATEWARREARVEYYGQFPLPPEVYALQHWVHSRMYSQIRGMALFSGVGIFLWLMALLGRGIMWWIKRR